MRVHTRTFTHTYSMWFNLKSAWEVMGTCETAVVKLCASSCINEAPTTLIACRVDGSCLISSSLALGLLHLDHRYDNIVDFEQVMKWEVEDRRVDRLNRLLTGQY